MKDKTMAPATGATRVVLALALAGGCAFAQASAQEAVRAGDSFTTSEPAAAIRPSVKTAVKAAESVETGDASETAQSTAAPSAASSDDSAASAGAAPNDTTALDATVTDLPPVTVSAHDGEAVPYDCTGVSVSIIDVRQKIREGVTDLAPALEEVPGLFIIPGGGECQRGNVASVTLRGMSGGNDVMPMMDGMRLTNTSANLTQNVLARESLFGLGNVEVLRGPQGAVYGGGSMGGVIYMETPRGKGEPTLSVFNEVGSFDSYTHNTTFQGEYKRLAYFLSVTYDHTNNDISYADGSKPGIRHAGRYTNWQEALRLDCELNDDNTLTLTYRRQDADYNYTERYTDYFTGLPTESLTPYSFRSNLVTAKLNSRINELYSTSFMAGYYGINNDLGNNYWTELRNVQLEWRNSLRWNDQLTTTAGFAWQRSLYTVKSGMPPVRDRQGSNLENTYSVFAEQLYTPVKNWENSLALRLETSSIYGSHFSFRAASNYRFNGERSRLFASVGTGYRAPSSFQRSDSVYGTAYADYYGNPALDCETSVSVDLGFEQEIARDHSFSATLFWQQKQDAITLYGETDPTTYRTMYRYANATGHWTIQGVELALQGTLEKRWNTGYRLACTLTQPLTEADRQIVSSARQTWYADLHTSPLEGLTTGIGLVAAAGRTGWDATQGRLDSYYSLRWYATYEVNKHLSLHLRVENLTDQKFVTYQAYGDPANSIINAGLGVYGGFTLTF